eukprot:TRINITY_DN6914_c0_g3_i1.p1 TRINITY_DN6914_c0_g3~~TRINITY_DN6914_c0_g3_i1.p1  ORF type:complete len:770 (+),score=225.65 TRINITY_DN6914_c0_g3_i1:49-2358(+)
MVNTVTVTPTVSPLSPTCITSPRAPPRASIPLTSHDDDDDSAKPKTWCQKVRGCLVSVQFFLPLTIGMMLLIVSVVTITLLVTNTNSAVESMAHDLHESILLRVNVRLEQHLGRVLEINRASAATLARKGIPKTVPRNESILANHEADYVVEMLDDKINNYGVVDVHYYFYPDGRNVAVLRGPPESGLNLYAEEYQDGYQGSEPATVLWPYRHYAIDSLLNVTANPHQLLIPYVGAEKPYFKSPSRAIPFDYKWENPYVVGQFLLYTCTMSVVDAEGNFLGVMGADSYLSSMNSFVRALETTPSTKVFVLDPSTAELVMASHGDVLTALNGTRTRINVAGSSDGAIAAVGRERNWKGFEGSTTMSFEHDGQRWLLAGRQFNALGTDLTVVVITPDGEFMSEVRAATAETIWICASVTVAGVALALALCFVISNNLNSLDRGLQAVARLDLDQMRESAGNAKKRWPTFSELERTNDSYVRLQGALTAFKHYVPVGVVKGVLGGTIAPEPKMLPSMACVMFQDIVGFTGLCEVLPIDNVVEFVSRMFDEMTQSIEENHGTIDKYIGDAIMSFWEVGSRNLASAEAACRSATRAIHFSLTLETMVHDRHVSMRSGLHFGEVLVGNFGSRSRFSYTVLGNTVNTAARMEPLNKELKTKALISHQVAQRLEGDSLQRTCRSLGPVLLVGKNEATPVYEVGISEQDEEIAQLWGDVIAAFEAGLPRECRQAMVMYRMRVMEDPAADELMHDIGELEEQVRTGDSPLSGVRKQRSK